MRRITERFIASNPQKMIQPWSMTERVPCKAPGCSNTILPSTAADTGGICMPCANARARAEREEFIKNNRVDVNLYAGVSDPVEVLKIMHVPRKFDPLKNLIPYPKAQDKIYSELTSAQQFRMVEHAIEIFKSGDKDTSEDIARNLAAFTNADISRLLWEFIKQANYYPAIIFRDAPAEIRDYLINRLNEDSDNRNHLLMALAFIGDDVVVKLFAKWRANKPAWATRLHIPPENYSLQAGWELDEHGRRRDLYLQIAHALVKETSTRSTVSAFVPTNELCPWCGKKLVALLRFDAANQCLEIGLNQLQVTTCDVCTAYGYFFSRCDSNGSGQSHSKNVRPEFLPKDGASWERMKQHQLYIAESRTALFAADQFLPTHFSQVGGHAAWIQDAEYPECPDCGRTMTLIAQLCCDELEPYTEGTYYAYLCKECLTTATHYQQT